MYNDLLKENTSTDNFNTVYWNDAKCNNKKLPEGKLILEAMKFGTIEKIKAEHTVKILTVNNMSLGELKTNTSEVPKGKHTIYISLPTKTINYYETNTNINNFEWTLPIGWTGANGKSGTFITNTTDLNVLTDEYSEGEIKVRALNNQGANFEKSLYSSVSIKRIGIEIGEYPKTIPLGESKSYTFSVKTPQTGYFEWQAPEGWVINGEGNIYKAKDKPNVLITTGKCYTSEKVRVRVTNNLTTPWSEFLYTVEIPSINYPAGLVQYHAYPFSLTMPNDNITSVQWLLNGDVVATETGKSETFLLLNKSGNVKVSAKVLIQGCEAYVAIPAVE